MDKSYVQKNKPMNYSNFIAALDIGSSKITLTLATRTTTGEINILDSETATSNAVRHGRIINENAVAKEIQSLILKVQQRQATIIKKVYVTTGGSILTSVTNTVTKELGEGSIVTSATIDHLVDANLSLEINNDEEILDIKPLSYKIDGETVDTIEGQGCHNVEVNYLIVKGKKDSIEKIKNTLKTAEVQMAEMFLSPVAIAETTLTAKEKSLGTAAVEIGKSSTKIAIYQGDRLRFITTIPLGGQLITSDLSACLDITNETAELLTKDQNFGAVCANLVEDADIMLRTTSSIKKSYPSRKIVEIIEARIEEILLNIMHQFERSGFMYLLSGGIVISGGVSEVKNLTQFVKMKTNINARIADIKPFFSANSTTKIPTAKNAETCGMLIMGDTICKKEEKEDKKKVKVEKAPEKRERTKGFFGKLPSLWDMLDEKDETIED